MGISTKRPVGGTPGSSQSISQLWVKRMTNSSTTCSAPTVREIGVRVMSGGLPWMK
ncbi:Uncharacterised protein [Klebsiella pneumoniae]|nr:Uncharacterised protein [Klebsiella pneumoniae]